MTNDFLLAEQAGLIGPSSRVGESHAAAQRFADLIRADEREACATLIEGYSEWLGERAKADIAKFIRVGVSP